MQLSIYLGVGGYGGGYSIVCNLLLLFLLIYLYVVCIFKYKGIRYCLELGWYILEICFVQFCKCKIWLGMYKIVEEVVCVFDVGIFYMKKFINYNFEDFLFIFEFLLENLIFEEEYVEIQKKVKVVVVRV